VPGVLPGLILQFGEFQLDCGRYELQRKGMVLRVERKPMELLILLAGHRGQLVTRKEIAERLWSSEVFVDTEHGINTAIRKLRYLLRDDPDEPAFIQTVTGMGYRFVADVSEVEQVPAVVAASPAEPVPEMSAAPVSKSKRNRLGWYVAACAVLAIGGAAAYRFWERPQAIRYKQLTDFTDSAVAPALSPNGRMVAFIRGGGGFLTSDQIWVKMLPNGEARRVTDDDRPKYGLAFSPDGSQIAYTALDDSGFSTYEVSALGGEPHLLVKNAAGLVWLDEQNVLFSERRAGIHLGVVKATLTREGLRDVYFPAHERGMAHYSFPSPDRQWALVVEMNGNGDWAPCRLVALDGGGPSRQVGPQGGCTSAGWSGDGRWMHFTARVNEQSHIWRQRFPEGTPEQITFGPTEEEGIAVEPGGHALITSAGVDESAIWIRDGSSERQLSSEGDVEQFPAPVFSPDASMLYYLLRRGGTLGAELWRTDVDSGRNEAVFPGVSINEFDLSRDGKQAVYTTAAEGTTELWMAPVNRSSSPKKLGIAGARAPHFGTHGRVYFQRADGNQNFLERIESDGSRPAKLFPVIEFQSVSPNGKWVIASRSNAPEGTLPTVAAYPADGGAPRQICASYCFLKWSLDGKFLFVPMEDPTRMGPGRSLAVPLGTDESLPEFPAGGILPMADASVVKGAESVGRGNIVPGEDSTHYAWVNTTSHRNLYRISLP
jgi:DNA-binding winged helix-turn-helix (wHTH) protein/Tol biopolymer transport system component